jgi:DNA-binding transcriptional regulator YhcF (GntR family)
LPRAERVDPLHIQIANYLKREILEGRLREGDQLPSIRQLASDWAVGQNVAQRAIELLRSGKLVTTSTNGTFVAAPRNTLGPQQRLRLNGSPDSEQVTVTAAGLVPAPGYILPLLGLDEGSAVIRREEVTRQPDGSVFMLAVHWCPPQSGVIVPELLLAEPLPDPRGAGPLIADRLSLDIDWGRGGVECRQALDDGRELVHLGLEPGAYVLAGVHFWSTAGEDGIVLEYAEYVLPPNCVIEYDLEPLQ